MSLEKTSKISDQIKDSEVQLRCSVKNCGCSIVEGEEIKFGGKIYCKICGTQIISQTFSLF